MNCNTAHHWVNGSWGSHLMRSGHQIKPMRNSIMKRKKKMSLGELNEGEIS